MYKYKIGLNIILNIHVESLGVNILVLLIFIWICFIIIYINDKKIIKFYEKKSTYFNICQRVEAEWKFYKIWNKEKGLGESTWAYM